jgi:golgi SNAP receptor complex member 2
MNTTAWQSEKSSLQSRKKHSRMFSADKADRRRRVKEFRTDLVNLRSKFDSLKRLQQESALSQNRNELFGRRGFHSATPENPYDTSRIRTNGGLTSEESMLQEGSFLKKTEGQLDEFIGRGMAVLDNLVEQKGFLKVRTCR